MKKNIFIWQVAGLTFTAVLGTILHFLFEWTNLIIFAPISAVNESTFEHMKLIFVPSLIFAIVQSCFLKGDYKCFWTVKFIGIFLGTLLLPVLFYTLGGAFGTLSAIINVLIFFVAVIVEYFFEFWLFEKKDCSFCNKWVYLSVLIGIFILFIVLTFYPPEIPLFLDPVTKGYGIVK